MNFHFINIHLSKIQKELPVLSCWLQNDSSRILCQCLFLDEIFFLLFGNYEIQRCLSAYIIIIKWLQRDKFTWNVGLLLFYQNIICKPNRNCDDKQAPIHMMTWWLMTIRFFSMILTRKWAIIGVLFVVIFDLESSQSFCLFSFDLACIFEFVMIFINGMVFKHAK